jgi:predicted RNase H-like HicB family nuclease
MESKFTAIIEKDGVWYIAYCPEIPGANGQGKTAEEAKESLAAAISLILDDRLQDALRGLPADAIRDEVFVS